nr:S8 family serine peptidase [Clostridiales bacterium]
MKLKRILTMLLAVMFLFTAVPISMAEDGDMPGNGPEITETTSGDTDPVDSGDADPADPGDVDPADPGDVDPVDPGNTDPVDPGDVDPTDPGNTDPVDPGDVDPADPGDVDPVDPGDVDPTDPEEPLPTEEPVDPEPEARFAVRFVSDLPFTVTVEGAEPEEDGSFLLVPGDYLYSAYPSDEGYAPILNASFTVADADQEIALTFEPAEPEPEVNETMLRYGVPGFDRDLTEDEIEAKAALAEAGIAGSVAGKTAGKDYVEGCVILLGNTDPEEAAAAFDAEIRGGEYITVLLLNTMTVEEAVRAAEDPKAKLPAVEPNWYRHLEPNWANGGSKNFDMDEIAAKSGVPTKQTWEDMKGNDPFLQRPSATLQYDIDSGTQYTSSGAGTQAFQYMHSIVDSYAAWGASTGEGVTVGVLDSGVASHEDLSGVSALTSSAGVSGSHSSDDHGTHVAGIIAARRNSRGGAGIAPDASILAFNDYDTSGEITTELMVEGVHALVDNGADLINVSQGGPGFSFVERDAFVYAAGKGVPVIAAAGNDGMMTFNYPAGYPYVISVAATDPTNQRAPYSTYGAATVSAPGSYIMSTVPSSKYESYNGTSMAAPVVSGVVALYYGALGTRDLNGDGTVNLADVQLLTKKLKASCVKVTGSGTGMGAGIVNAGKLLAGVAVKPRFKILNLDDSNYSGSTSTVPTAAKIRIFAGDDATNFLVYTLDGSKPAVKNGKVTKGTAVEDNYVDIMLPGRAAGKLTVKALGVNGEGSVSAISTLTVTLDNSMELVCSVTTPVEFLAKGKTVQLKADVTPKNSSVTYVWSTLSPYVTLTSAGKITVKASAPAGESVTVNVAAKRNGIIVEQADKTFMIIDPFTGTLGWEADSGIIPGKTITLNAGENGRIRMTGADDLYCGRFTVTSSNPAVAITEPSSLITGGFNIRALKAGTATLTFTLADGSNKKVAVKITVVQPVTDISISAPENVFGEATVGIGKTVTLKPVFNNGESKPTNTKVTWWVDEESKSYGITISAAGALKIPNNPSLIGRSVRVYCKSTDGTEIGRDLLVRIVDAGGALKLDVATRDNRSTWSKGVLKTLTLYSYDVEHSVYGGDETVMQLISTTENVIWTSSKPSVATVIANGIVQAHNAGSTTITCAATDGSGRKASVTVKVINPASSISIMADTTRNSANYYADDGYGHYDYVTELGFGKNVTLKSKIGADYGKPSVTKLAWKVDGVFADDGNQIFGYKPSDIKISNGKLTIAKMGCSLFNIWKVDDRQYYVRVTATTTDGTELSATRYVWIAWPATFLTAVTKPSQLLDSDFYRYRYWPS